MAQFWAKWIIYKTFAKLLTFLRWRQTAATKSNFHFVVIEHAASFQSEVKQRTTKFPKILKIFSNFSFYNQQQVCHHVCKILLLRLNWMNIHNRLNQMINNHRWWTIKATVMITLYSSVTGRAVTTAINIELLWVSPYMRKSCINNLSRRFWFNLLFFTN